MTKIYKTLTISILDKDENNKHEDNAINVEELEVLMRLSNVHHHQQQQQTKQKEIVSTTDALIENITQHNTHLCSGAELGL
jgi:predicted DNA-binding protein (UPF0251 family)